MKKILFALLFLTSSVVAQKISIAPVFGINMSTIVFSQKTQDDYFRIFNSTYDGGGEISFFNPRVSPSFGAIANYNEPGKAWGFRTGLTVSMRGGKLVSSGTVQRYAVKISLAHRMSYLEVPLHAVYEFHQSGIRLIAGPTIGFALNGKGIMKQSVNGQPDEQEAKLDVGSDKLNDEVKPIDLSLSIGVAKVIPVANRLLEISLFAQPSFTKYNPSSKVKSDSFGRHLTAGLRVAYFFVLD
jgi:hypothetical protein